MSECNEASRKKMSALMKARFPYVYIPTWEEERAVEMVRGVAGDAELIRTVRKVYVWTATDGFVCEQDKKQCADTAQPVRAIEFVRQCGDHAVFIFKDFHVHFGVKNRPLDYMVIRKLRDIIPCLKTGELRKTVVFISPELIIPEDMQKEISVFEFALPTVQEIRIKLDQMVTENSMVQTNLNEEEKEKMAKAALGLTLQEAENAFARAMVSDGRFDISDLAVIMDEKNQVVRKTGILEFIKSDLGLEDIGGLENLKRWLQKRNNSWLDSAKKYNIPSPKGVLITGVPGCGKSLTAKAMSAIWQLPLLKLDMGKIFSGIVGSSEENMRRAIQTAEAVAPSILWVDEIEKGLAGLGSTGDSGTSSRIFGTFLTWMQDKTAPVFVIATANNISTLPPELLRKGRFDEIFFVDLPTFKERREIFRLHLNKRLKDPEVAKGLEIDEGLLDELARLTDGFVGAEIEQVVISALYEAFFAGRELLVKDLKAVIANTVPLSITQKEQIMSLREWANVRAVAATAKEDRQVQSDVVAEGGVQYPGGRTIDF
ncbi:AAA family ATPase [Clostridia bacterium OttesenSCG-928-O13]|nr:AAA family ATPase [Clostridia bacterium OttesenSCG-928-O13]